MVGVAWETASRSGRMRDRVASNPADDLMAAAGRGLALGAWGEARERYQQALELEETAEALEGLAVAAWWLDDVDSAICARERAYVLRREQGRTVEAARLAGFLAWDYGAMRGANAVASGWLARARRLVAELPPAAEHAWLPLIEASFFLDTDAAEVLRLSSEAVEHARRHGALDIEMTGRTLQGLALVSLGRIADEMLVTIGVGFRDLGRAREAHRALHVIATAVGTDSLHAAERRAAGEIAMADGDGEEAARLFEDAVDLHRRSEAAFDLARVAPPARTGARGE